MQGLEAALCPAYALDPKCVRGSIEALQLLRTESFDLEQVTEKAARRVRNNNASRCGKSLQAYR